MTIDFDEFEEQFKELDPERDEKVEAMKNEIMVSIEGCECLGSQCDACDNEE